MSREPPMKGKKPGCGIRGVPNFNRIDSMTTPSTDNDQQDASDDIGSIPHAASLPHGRRDNYFLNILAISL